MTSNGYITSSGPIIIAGPCAVTSITFINTADTSHPISVRLYNNDSERSYVDLIAPDMSLENRQFIVISTPVDLVEGQTIEVYTDVEDVIAYTVLYDSESASQGLPVAKYDKDGNLLVSNTSVDSSSTSTSTVDVLALDDSNTLSSIADNIELLASALDAENVMPISVKDVANNRDVNGSLIT